ncbi:MAG TPA: hypothetical protein VHY91_05760 [Pirellulales bacterium]|nr:hypothetical protein [Pirellulales bacterium]
MKFEMAEIRRHCARPPDDTARDRATDRNSPPRHVHAARHGDRSQAAPARADRMAHAQAIE